MLRRDHERGGVAFAMLIVLVVSITGAIALGAGVRSLSSSTELGTSAQARAAAEIGLAEAAVRIGGGAATDFATTATVGSGTATVTATRDGADAWSVAVDVDIAGATRSFRSAITRGADLTVSVFAVSAMRVTDNDGTVDGAVATNGSMEIVGRAPGAAQVLYRPDGTCTGCADPVVRDGPRPIPSTDPPTGTTRDCPTDGELTGPVDGANGVPIVCDDPTVPLVLLDDVTILRPPLVVHVGPDVAVRLDGATVGAGGASDAFRLVAAGSGPLEADGASVTGTIIAPERTLRTAATAVVGSIVVGELIVEAGAVFDVRPDVAAAPGGDAWRIGDLVPVG
ncbi:MAG: hypothetical protein ACE367_27360 [Acidimicrobiales bacterium]